MLSSYRNRKRNFQQAFGALGRASRYAGPMVMRRLAQRYKSGGSFTRVKRRKNVHSGQGVTTQHDERRIYTKRNMPRRKKRAWKKFSYKVLAVSEKDLGSRTVVFNKLQAFSNTTSGNQGLAYCALYSANGTGDSFMADLSSISALENTGNPTAASGGTVALSSKYIFKSAIMDVTFRNTSTLYNGTTANLASEAKLEVDVYEILSSRQWSDTNIVISDATGAIKFGTDNVSNIGGAGTGVALTLRGTTPWDAPFGLSYWRLKILKKTKYFVPNGDTFTYQVRDPKRRVSSEEKLQAMEGGNFVGWTRHLLVVFKLVPGLTVGTATVAGNYQESLTLGITRKYFYKIEGFNEDRDRYIVG